MTTYRKKPRNNHNVRMFSVGIYTWNGIAAMQCSLVWGKKGTVDGRIGWARRRYNRKIAKARHRRSGQKEICDIIYPGFPSCSRVPQPSKRGGTVPEMVIHAKGVSNSN
jgi:hypothetical protein